jgi:hypothetical protein
MAKARMKSYRLTGFWPDGRDFVSVCQYDWDSANDYADRLETDGFTDVEIWEVDPFSKPKDLLEI